MSKFYVVATPIGNMEDVTFRAISVLKSVDLILCEDTRVTQKLLHRYEISKPTYSYNAHSTDSKVEKVFEAIREGKNIALVSDAGTPAISDPGSLLVSQVREFSKKENVPVEIFAIPGASAVTSALSISGFPSSDFLFLGFLPHKRGRETLFREIASSERTAVFYESPHRIEKALESLAKFLEPNRQIAVARELTKIYEEFVSGTPAEVAEYFKKNQDKVRGEFVVMVSAKS